MSAERQLKTPCLKLHGGMEVGRSSGHQEICSERLFFYMFMPMFTLFFVYMAQPWAPPPPPPGMVMVPCPAPCGSGWGGCGWVGMLVDGVVVFANDVESYGICKELY